MIITEQCIIKNKIMIFSELTRIDEHLAALIENNYDDVDATQAAIETLEVMGFELELKINQDDSYICAEPLFDEIQEIRNELITEIENGDLKIHYNKKYGYDESREYYLKYNMITE